MLLQKFKLQLEDSEFDKQRVLSFCRNPEITLAIDFINCQFPEVSVKIVIKSQ